MEQAYKKLRDRVFRRALMYVENDQTLAEDIVQEVFLSWLLYQKRNNKRSKQTIDQAVIEACRKLFGRTGNIKNPQGRFRFEELIPELGGLYGYFIEEKDDERLEQLQKYYEEFLLTIFKDEKKLFLLKYVDGLSQAKIGQIFGVSESRITQRTKALKEKIRKFKERKDGANGT